MTDKHDNNERAAAFIKGVSSVGKATGVTPNDALELFGQMARQMIDFQHAHGDGSASYEQLVQAALNRFASGIGGMVSEVTIVNPEGGLH